MRMGVKLVLAFVALAWVGAITGTARAAHPPGHSQAEPAPSTSKPRFEFSALLPGGGEPSPIWARNPDAARWAVDGMFSAGFVDSSGESALAGELSGRYAFLPGLSVGASLAYSRTRDVSDYPYEYRSWMFPGAFLEVHLFPEGRVDVWLRTTGGVAVAVERNARYELYDFADGFYSQRRARGFFEMTLGLSFGSRSVRVGPFVTAGGPLFGLGWRLDVLFPEGPPARTTSE